MKQWLAMIATVASCHGSGSGADAPPTTYGPPLSCSSQQLCARGGPCDLTLAAAMNDTALCPASYQVCGDDWTIVTTHGIDTSTSYFYRNGQLVAVTQSGIVLNGCVEGPASFAPPTCDGSLRSIPACPSGQ
jgi:hypothetical protein